MDKMPSSSIFLVIACLLTVSTTAAAQRKNADVEAAQKNLEEAQKRADESIATARKASGFPPEDDLVGTTIHCAKLSSEWRAKADACIAQQLKQLMANTTEPAETIADAVIGGCRSALRQQPSGFQIYCMDRGTLQRVTDQFIKARREFAVTEIVRHRTGKPPSRNDESSATVSDEPSAEATKEFAFKYMRQFSKDISDRTIAAQLASTIFLLEKIQLVCPSFFVVNANRVRSEYLLRQGTWVMMFGPGTTGTSILNEMSAKQNEDFNNTLSKKEWCERVRAFAIQTLAWGPLFNAMP